MHMREVSVSNLAKATGVKVPTIRYYESANLAEVERGINGLRTLLSELK